MSNILQPTDNDRATIYAIAWDIVKRELDTGDQRLSPDQIASTVAKVVARLLVDGGCRKKPLDEEGSNDD